MKDWHCGRADLPAISLVWQRIL